MNIVWKITGLIGTILALLIIPASKPWAFAQPEIVTPSPQISQETTIQVVDQYVSKFSAQMLKEKGWIHVVEQHIRGLEDVGSLPNGVPIPLNYISDSWYFIDSDGKVTKAVTYMKTLEGDIVQESAFDGKQWKNFTTGDIIVRGPYQLNLDFEFSQDISRGPGAYDEVRSRDIELNNKQVLAVLAREDFDAPGQFAGMTEPLTSIKSEAYFDKDSGKLIYIERIGTDVDGGEHKIERAAFQAIERGDPSTEILTLLNKASK